MRMLRFLFAFLLLASAASAQTLVHPEKVVIKPKLADRTDAALTVWGGVTNGSTGTVMIDADGTVGGWTINTNYLEHSRGWIYSLSTGSAFASFGNPPPLNNYSIGVLLGWSGTPAAGEAVLWLYGDATNYLRWESGKLVWKAANAWLDGSGDLYANAAATTDSFYPLVINGSYKILSKTDGSDGTLCTGYTAIATLTVEKGLITGATCWTHSEPFDRSPR